jgi:hypothetical protein
MAADLAFRDLLGCPASFSRLCRSAVDSDRISWHLAWYGGYLPIAGYAPVPEATPERKRKVAWWKRYSIRW